MLLKVRIVSLTYFIQYANTLVLLATNKNRHLHTCVAVPSLVANFIVIFFDSWPSNTAMSTVTDTWFSSMEYTVSSNPSCTPVHRYQWKLNTVRNAKKLKKRDTIFMPTVCRNNKFWCYMDYNMYVAHTKQIDSWK